MTEEKGARSPDSGAAADMGWHPTGAPPNDPGWYPMGTNPNDQSYWDGKNWTGRRHWTVNGWSEEGAAGSASQERLTSGNPYAAPAAARNRSGPSSLNIGVLLVLVSGIALMFGSVGSWVHANASIGPVAFHGTLNGIDPGISQLIGVDGYVTFIGGIVLLVLGGVALTNSERSLAVLTFVVAGAVLIVAVYDTFRIVQKISNVSSSAQSSVSVGAGLICVLSAAVLAIIVTTARLASR